MAKRLASRPIEEAPVLAGPVLVGAIAGAHGVRGEVLIKSFTAAPADVGAYGPLSDESGRRFALRALGMTRGFVVAHLAGVGTRDAAVALKGKRLYVARSALPAPAAEEWYVSDLVGLRVEDTEGRIIGRVKAMHDFGAGDVMEIEREPGGDALWLAFCARTVPAVDLAGGRLVVDPPAEIEVEPEGGQEDLPSPAEAGFVKAGRRQGGIGSGRRGEGEDD